MSKIVLNLFYYDNSLWQHVYASASYQHLTSIEYIDQHLTSSEFISVNI